MKNKIYSLKAKAVLLTLVVLIGFGSCDERWAEMNTDPNRVSVMPDEYLFTSAVKQTFNTQMDRFEVDFGGQYSLCSSG